MNSFIALHTQISNWVVQTSTNPGGQRNKQTEKIEKSVFLLLYTKTSITEQFETVKTLANSGTNRQKKIENEFVWCLMWRLVRIC